MSRTFDGTPHPDSKFMSVGSAIVTATPCTFAAWVRVPSNSTNRVIAVAQDIDSNSLINCFCVRLNTTGQVLALAANSAGSSASTTAGTLSVDTWHHVAGVFASATSRTAYLDGAAAAANTTSRIPSGIDNFHVGVNRFFTVLNALEHTGEIGELAVWSIALSGAEVLSLAGGTCPTAVQTANIISHWRISGDNSPEPDDVGSNDLVLTGVLPKAEDPPTECVYRSNALLRLPRIAGDMMGVPFNGTW